MICPRCSRHTTRMVYPRTGGKLCANCADPNYFHDLVTPDITESVREISRMQDLLAQPLKDPPGVPFKCVIDYNVRTMDMRSKPFVWPPIGSKSP